MVNPSPLKHSQPSSRPSSPGFSGRQHHRRRLVSSPIHSSQSHYTRERIPSPLALHRHRGPQVVSATAVAKSSAPPLLPLPRVRNPVTRQILFVFAGLSNPGE
ncbi:uncharacterized protein DS421_13g414380 [Arachis hypogaea]|nr:uncharacterized protein DS421_13g414380 [Arachis hypogaea]